MLKRRLGWFLLLMVAMVGCGPTTGPQAPTMTLPEGPARPVEVTFASPTGEVETLDDTSSIMVGFNQPMVPLRPIPKDESVGPLYLEPSQPGHFRWKGTATLSFSPAQPLPYATHFKATVPAQTPSLKGQALQKDYVFEFETPRPLLTRSSPEDEDKWVGLDRQILLAFNQPVDPARLSGSVELIAIDEKGKETTLPVTLETLNEDEKKAFVPAEEEKPEEAGSAASPSVDPLTTCVAVRPKQALQPATSYRVVLKKGLIGAQGPLGSTEEKTFTFSTYNRFSVSYADDKDQSVDPESSFHLSFSNPVTYGEIFKNLKFQPAVEIPESYRDDESADAAPYLYIRFKPQQKYTLTVSADLKDQFGNRLGKDATFSFKTGDLNAYVTMPTGTAMLESRLPQLRIPVGMQNMGKVKADLAVLGASDVVHMLADREWYQDGFEPPGGWKFHQRLEGNTVRNEVQDRFIELEKVLPSKTGWVFASIPQGDYNRRLLVQVTNLGLTAKFSPENTVVFVTTLNEAAPVPGASVQLLDEDAKVLWSGKTGKDGSVSAPGWHALKLAQTSRWDQPDLYVVARSGNDQALISTNYQWSVSPWVFHLDYDYYPTLPTLVAEAFTERGLYRAGEEVQVKGVMREIRAGRYILPEGKQLDFKLTDSRDQLVQLGVVNLDGYGAFNHTLKIAARAPTGYYTLWYYQPGDAKRSLKDNDYGDRPSPVTVLSFRVEAYRPAQFEVKVESDVTTAAIGDKVKASFLGRYLFGGAMQGDSLSWTARAEPTSFAPSGWDGYDFGISSWLEDDEDYDYGERRRDRDESVVLGKGQGTLDAEGRKQVEVDLSGLKFKQSAILTLEGTVTSASRQQISGRAQVMVHPGAFLIGLRPKSIFQTAGSPVQVDVVTTDAEGKAVAGNQVGLELFRREWNSVRRAEVGGAFRWVVTHQDKKVSETTVTSSDGPAVASLKPDKSGFYVVKAQAQDAKGRVVESVTSFYASGSDYVAWGRAEGDSIELVADKKAYKPGDTAHILVKSPYEKATAIVTVERELVMRRYVRQVTGSTPTIDLPLQSEDLPNAFVSVILLSGRVQDRGFDQFGDDLGKPQFKIGYVNLPVDTGEKHLKVTVKTDREEYRPGGKVTLDLQVEDSRGRPVRAQVAVGVVDRGVLNLINYPTPDLFGPFYGPRALRVSTAETRLDVIGMRSYGTKGDGEGGGGGEGADFREDFKATAYWNPAVVTDRNGHAQVSFDLPDSLTSFRVMATALTQSSDFGSGESEFRVNKPLQMLPSQPRFVRLKDEFKAGVLVHNNTKAAGSVEVRVSATGLTLLGSPTSTVPVGAGEEKEVLFGFRADQGGTGMLAFEASMGADTDAMKLPLPVQNPPPTETVGTTGSFEESEVTEGLELTSKPVAGVGGLTVSLSSTLMSGLGGALKYVQDYPYGCLEQHLTRMAPTLLVPDLLKAFPDPERPDAAIREAVQSALEDLASFQSPEGGFYLWPGSDRVNDYLTVYAVELMTRARKQGLHVDDFVANQARAYLKQIPSKDEFDYPYSADEKFLVRAYAVDVLAQLGVKDFASFDNLYADRKDAGLEARVHLLRAAILQGRKEADTLRSELVGRIRAEAATAYFEEKDAGEWVWTYGSNTRLTALVLAVLLEDKGEFQYAPQMVKWLFEKQSRGHWGNTQDDICVLVALDAYRQRYEKDEPDFTGQVSVGGKPVMQESFRGRMAAVVQKVIPSVELPGGKVPVVLQKKGKGRLYYSLRLQYAPSVDVPARDEGFMVFKQVTPLEGDPNDPDLKAGQIYRVTLSVVTPQERHFVVLDDPVPGGVEVVQTTFETESDNLRKALKLSGSSPWGGTFEHFEINDDRVLLFADVLAAGEHTFEYLVRAGYAGTYEQPATHAEEMYHPEVFGTTAKRKVTIR